MITTAIALLVTLHCPQQDPGSQTKQTASQIMSKVFSHYAGAQAVSGVIKMSQTAQGVTVNIESDLQFDRPGQIYLHQSKGGSKARETLLVSDGKRFAYDRPESRVFGKDRYLENVFQNGIDQKIPDLYMAAEQSLAEMNPILDMVICHPVRLNRLRTQWASLTYQGRVNINGELVSKVTGQYRESQTAPANGLFEIYVTEDGDVVRYILNQRFLFASLSRDPVDVKTVWDSTIKIGAKTDSALYKVH